MLGVSMMICVYVVSSFHSLTLLVSPTLICYQEAVLRLNLACFVRVMWNYVPECNNSWCSMIHCNQSNLSTTHFTMTRFWTSQMKEWVFDPVIMEYMQFVEKKMYNPISRTCNKVHWLVYRVSIDKSIWKVIALNVLLNIRLLYCTLRIAV